MSDTCRVCGQTPCNCTTIENLQELDNGPRGRVKTDNIKYGQSRAMNGSPVDVKDVKNKLVAAAKERMAAKNAARKSAAPRVKSLKPHEIIPSHEVDNQLGRVPDIDSSDMISDVAHKYKYELAKHGHHEPYDAVVKAFDHHSKKSGYKHFDHYHQEMINQYRENEAYNDSLKESNEHRIGDDVGFRVKNANGSYTVKGKIKAKNANGGFEVQSHKSGNFYGVHPDAIFTNYTAYETRRLKESELLEYYVVHAHDPETGRTKLHHTTKFVGSAVSQVLGLHDKGITATVKVGHYDPRVKTDSVTLKPGERVKEKIAGLKKEPLTESKFIGRYEKGDQSHILWQNNHYDYTLTKGQDTKSGKFDLVKKFGDHSHEDVHAALIKAGYHLREETELSEDPIKPSGALWGFKQSDVKTHATSPVKDEHNGVKLQYGHIETPDGKHYVARRNNLDANGRWHVEGASSGTHKYIKSLYWQYKLGAAQPTTESVTEGYVVTKTGKELTPGEFDSEATTTEYDIHKNGVKVGNLSYDSYFGGVTGKLHGKDLPAIDSYRGSNAQAKLHSFLKTKTGEKWASNLHKYQKEDTISEVLDSSYLKKSFIAKVGSYLTDPSKSKDKKQKHSDTAIKLFAKLNKGSNPSQLKLAEELGLAESRMGEIDQTIEDELDRHMTKHGAEFVGAHLHGFARKIAHTVAKEHNIPHEAARQLVNSKFAK